MKTLLWKDYRHNRQLLAVVGAFYLLLYACFAMVSAAQAELHSLRDLGEAICVTSIPGLFLYVLVTAFIAGNAFAGERVDRSAEFIAYLPIRRRAAVASKAILAVSACVLVWGANTVVMVAGHLLFREFSQMDVSGFVLSTAVATVFVFGVSWLFSAFLNSPASAAASGLATAILAAAGTFYVVQRLWRPMEPLPDCWVVGYMFGVILVGVGCFVAGSIVALRRVEP